MLDQSLPSESISNPLFIWAELDSRARLVVDDGLNVLWQNTAAPQFIEEAQIFKIDLGSISVRYPRQHALFVDFVRASGKEVSSLCLPCPDDDHVLCTAISLANDPHACRTGLTLRRASRATVVGAAFLESVFQLTPAERKVVEKLFAGCTAEEIGDGFHLSIGTIRVHIRHIYDKLNVCSREAMFRKILPFMLVR